MNLGRQTATSDKGLILVAEARFGKNERMFVAQRPDVTDEIQSHVKTGASKGRSRFGSRRRKRKRNDHRRPFGVDNAYGPVRTSEADMGTDDWNHGNGSSQVPY